MGMGSFHANPSRTKRLKEDFRAKMQSMYFDIGFPSVSFVAVSQFVQQECRKPDWM